MKLAPKQKILLDFAREHEGKLTTFQAVALLSHVYPTNAPHFVAMILNRMEREGKLTRITHGNYQLTEKQTSLF